jgi:energy-coupling factor transporter ATP-binding protein EcfA2
VDSTDQKDRIVASTVFLVGHPGSGKTSLYRNLSGKLARSGQQCHRVSDREFFADAERNDYGRLGRMLRETEWQCEWLFIELTSSDFLSTTDALGRAWLRTCQLVVVLASLETSIARNRRRLLVSEDMDEYRIPEEYICECFAQSFRLENLPPLFYSAVLIENDGDELEALASLAVQVAERLVSDRPAGLLKHFKGDE